MAPNISRRKYIKWANEPAHEDTSTTVLTSSKNYYVDIRLKVSSSTPLQHEDIQWAFAGTAESSTNSDGSRHTKWHHFVDSKSKDPESDAGDMWEQEDGDTLEKGEMAHPVTGVITPYEELWTDLPIGGPYPVWGEEKKVCVVLMLDVPDSDARGMIIRIGGIIQGFLRVGEDIDVGVWILSEDQTWERTEHFAKPSFLDTVAFVLFEVREDDESLAEGKYIGPRADAEDPELLSLDRETAWKVMERVFM